MIMHLATPEEALQHWPIISSFLLKAKETGQGESSMADYMNKILNMNAQCWVIIEDNKVVGAGLTEIMSYCQHKTLHIILFSGVNFAEQYKMLAPVEQFARDNNCKCLEMWGRKGWAKTLPKYIPEFKEVYTVMRKDL